MLNSGVAGCYFTFVLSFFAKIKYLNNMFGGLGLGLGVRLVLILLGTLSQYYFTHIITPC